MAERSTVTQAVQIGVESTAGTAVAASKSLSSMKIDLSIKSEAEEFRANASKYAAMTAQGREWTEGRISGQPNYEELQVLFCTLFKNVTPSTVDTSARLWSFDPSPTAEDTVKTLTVEQGSALRAHKAAYVLPTSLNLKIDRKKVDMSGTAMGQLLTDGITMTGTPTAYPIVPVLPKEWSVYMDTSYAGIGTTKLTRVFAVDFTFSNRFGPIWPVNSSNTSWAAHVELPIDCKIKLQAETDSAGMGLLTLLRSNATRFFRFEAVSSQLAGASTEPYSLTIDVAAQVTSPSDFQDVEGVQAIEWEMTAVNDSTMGGAVEIALVNKQTAI